MLNDDRYQTVVTAKRKLKDKQAFTYTGACLNRLSRKRQQCFKGPQVWELSLKLVTFA